MNREQIIEAMLKAWSEESGSPIKWMSAALTALETAIPGLADVIRGTACIVPAGHSFECAVNNETIYPDGPARPK